MSMHTERPPPKRRDVIMRLAISQLESGHYEYQLTWGTEELEVEAGFTSIHEAIEHAADIEGDILGFEVAYKGVVVGTYPLEALRASPETIAISAVEMEAALRNN